MPTHHLAQLNVARVLAPLDSPVMAEFVARLADINALAERSPGFVWRMQTEDGDATAVRPYDDASLIVNLTVWEGVEALHAYVYRSGHAEVMRRRREWFSRMAEAYVVLWWVPAGHRPDIHEAVARLDTLRRDGPTPDAFTFRNPFPPPGATVAPEPAADECPAG
jgi:hypothetical protein